MSRKSLPPFARDFAWGHGKDHQPWIFTGPDAWAWAKRDTRRLMVLPPDRSPADFRWPVNGLELIVLDCGGAGDDPLKLLIQELISAGAAKVLLIQYPCHMAIFTPRICHAA